MDEISSKSPVANDVPVAERWHEPFLRARSALVEWTAHSIVVAAFLIGFRVIEHLIEWLWHEDPILFGVLPLRYIFDGANLGVLLGFLTYGIIRVINSYRGK